MIAIDASATNSTTKIKTPIIISSGFEFYQNLGKLKLWFSNNKTYPSITSTDDSEIRLAMWIAKMRQTYSQLTITETTCLENIDRWYWELCDDHFISNYVDVITFVREHDRIPHNSKNKTDEQFMGKWCEHQRGHYKKKLLNEFKVRKLLNIPHWYWQRIDNRPWDVKYDEVLDFVNVNLCLPSRYSSDEAEMKLGKWCGTQRENYRIGEKNMIQDRITKLQSINGWFWTEKFVDPYSFETNYENLKSYIEVHKSVPSQESKCLTTRCLGKWCSKIRGLKNSNDLSDEKIQMFEKLSLWWWSEDLFQMISFEVIIIKILEFVNVHKYIPTRESDDPYEKYLGRWCSNQRSYYHHNLLSDERAKQLESIQGWFWVYVGGGHSKIALQWLKYVAINADGSEKSLQTILSPSGEFKIPDTLFKADGYDEKNTKVWEMLGDFWHGNPTICDANDVNPVRHVTYGELYKHTIQREDKIRATGLKYGFVWENSWRKALKLMFRCQKQWLIKHPRKRQITP